ncbi:uncharacterized protein PG986_005323 [Apiospora aurea]|uniref:Major facilitator superfamily (MFS) profile domain-containing protein n=1 Tax=Apiospora aurea TaxID=335848 RepID=A0ABR1QH78_9PEZI
MATATQKGLVSSAPTGSTPYSSMSRGRKRYLTYLLGYLCLVSSLSATIYFPLIPLLVTHYNTSVQAVNLTITLYVVFQGVAPSFWSPASDSLGRRPVFLGTFAVFAAASAGLCFSGRSLAALAVLRALQSVGGSAVLSISYGVVSDIVTHAERGSMLGPMMASANLGPCMGPVLGGSVTYAAGGQDFQWCFRALAIVGGSALLLVGWTLPETNRGIVGNGSVPAQGIWRTWWASLRTFRQSLWTPKQESKTTESRSQNATDAPGADDAEKSGGAGDASVSTETQVHSPTGRGRLVVPNPFSSLRLIFYWDTSLVLFLAASPYCLWYLIQTSIPIIYGTSGYDFSDIYVGLTYLAGGFGVIAGGFINGRLMDWNYRVVARQAGLPVNKHSGEDMSKFPIEMARSRGSVAILGVSVCAVIAFGWTVKYKIHPAVPLTLQFYIGAKCTVLHQAYSALLVDMFPQKPSTAGASNNIIRCALSAAAVAVLQPLVDALGPGWFFTMTALLDAGLSIIAVWVLRRWGMQWRSGRQQS